MQSISAAAQVDTRETRHYDPIPMHTEPAPPAVGPRPAASQETSAPPPRPSLAGGVHIALAGVLMGMANLIPGVSGGTMVLAMGLYQDFIDAVAELSSLRFSLRRIAFLVLLGGFAALSITTLAGVILWLLFHFPAGMYALFIGLTLGGAPLLWRELRPATPGCIAWVLVGLGAMISVFFLKAGTGMPHNLVMDVVAGVVGATTMVLPGVSGSYMLLVMDQYERIVGAVDSLRLAATAGDPAVLAEALWIVVPVGIGTVLGIVGLSHLLKYLLHHHHRPTVAFLLGVLLGSVAGLWPFNQSPKEKALEKRTAAELTAFVQTWQIPNCADLAEREALAKAIVANWPQRTVSAYTPGRIARVLILVPVGFAITFALSRIGEKPGSSLGRRGGGGGGTAAG